VQVKSKGKGKSRMEQFKEASDAIEPRRLIIAAGKKRHR
jgi:hypothetical protein